MSDELLRVDKVCGGYRDIQALWDVSLTARAGTVTAIFGRNGAGKTTLLSTIAGLLPVRSGTIEFEGRDVTASPAYVRAKAGIGLVQENKRIFRRRTVEENLVLGGHSIPRKRMSAALERAYAQFPALVDKRRAAAGSLSGGQQQMLGIAQALMPGPRLLMLDEPSTGLSPAIVQEVLDSVVRLKESGLGIVVVEQLIAHAMTIADDVLVLDQGRIVGAFAAEEIRGTDFLQATYLDQRTG